MFPNVTTAATILSMSAASHLPKVHAFLRNCTDLPFSRCHQTRTSTRSPVTYSPFTPHSTSTVEPEPKSACAFFPPPFLFRFSATSVQTCCLYLRSICHHLTNKSLSCSCRSHLDLVHTCLTPHYPVTHIFHWITAFTTPSMFSLQPSYSCCLSLFRH